MDVPSVPGSSSPSSPLSLPHSLPGAGASLAPGKRLLRQHPKPGSGFFWGSPGTFLTADLKKKTKQQNKRAMKVPCTRDVPLQNSTDTTGPSSQASSPSSSFLGRRRDKKHLAAVEGRKAPQAPGTPFHPGLGKHLRAQRPSGRRSRR